MDAKVWLRSGSGLSYWLILVKAGISMDIPISPAMYRRLRSLGYPEESI